MGAENSKDSRSTTIQVQPSARNQVVPVMEASQAAEPREDAARLRQQLQQEKEDHAKALEAAAAADRIRRDEAAAAERLRLDSEATSERKRLDEEAAAQRARLDRDCAQERKRTEETAATEAAANRKLLDDEAALERKRLDDEAALERKRLDDEAALERKRLDDEAAAERKILDETAAVERQRLDGEAAAARERLDKDAAAMRTQLDTEAAAVRKRLDDEAVAIRTQLDDHAAAERKRLDEEAAVERRRLDGVVAALQQQLQNLLARLSTAGPATLGTSTVFTSSPAKVEQLGSVSKVPEPVTPAVSLPAALPVMSGSGAVAMSAAAPVAAPAVSKQEMEQISAANQRRLEIEEEKKRQAALHEKEAMERRKVEETMEQNWGDQDMLAGIPTKDTKLDELPANILDLHDGMPAQLRQAPMRLLHIDAVLSWPNIRVYEEVTAEERVEIPYIDVDSDTWNSTLILSWRWSAAKPTEYISGFAPMSSLQYEELTAMLRRAKGQGIRHVWIDWCCVPQYESSPMVEVLRSKVFYARARAMVVLPTFVPIPAEGIVRLLLVKANRVIRNRADQTKSPRSQIVLRVLESIMEKQLVAGREYFTRVWTLAERMARFGRPEHLCNWLSLESWLGMLVDAMLKSTDDRSASEIYKRILGRDAGQRLDAILDPLEAAVKTGSMHVSEGLDEQVAELFELAVGIWHTERELSESPTKDWLVSYLLDAHSGIYQAWSEADRVWAVYSYFCWKQLDQRSESGLLEALQDLVRVAGGSRRLLMAMATKLGLAKVIAPAEADRQLVTAAEANDMAGLVAALEAGAFPDYPGTDGGAPLYFVAGKGNVDAVRMLLKCGAKVNGVDVMGRTALYAASLNGHADVIKVLVAAGADVSAAKPDGATPLHAAAETGHDAAVRELLRAGAKKDAIDSDGRTPLFMAVIKNDGTDIVRTLLEAGASKDVLTKAGTSILHGASRAGNEDIIRLLVHSGCDIHRTLGGEKALTPLHVAAEQGKAGAIRALVKAGAKLEASGSIGTALHRACVCGHLEAVKALLECGASTEAREPADRMTPLMEAAHRDNPAIVKVLLEAKAKVDAADKDNWRPIHFAASADSYECCKLLKAEGASTKVTTKNGNYPSDLCKNSRVRGILPDGRNIIESGGNMLLKAFF